MFRPQQKWPIVKNRDSNVLKWQVAFVSFAFWSTLDMVAKVLCCEVDTGQGSAPE